MRPLTEPLCYFGLKPQFYIRGQNAGILRPRIELNAQFGNYNSRILSISVVDTVQRGSKKSQFSIGKVGGYLTEHGPPPKSTYTVEVYPLDRFGRVTHGSKALNGVNMFAQPSVSWNGLLCEIRGVKGRRRMSKWKYSYITRDNRAGIRLINRIYAECARKCANRDFTVGVEWQRLQVRFRRILQKRKGGMNAIGMNGYS